MRKERIKLPLISEHNHLLLYAAAAFLAGCLLWPYIRVNGLIWAAVGITLIGGALLFLRGKSAVLCWICCFLCLGLLRTDIQMSLPQPETGSYAVSGYVSGAVRERGDGRLTFALKNVSLDGIPADGTAYCSFYYQDEEVPQLYDGAQIAFTGRVWLGGEKNGDAHMDFDAWMRQSGYRFGVTAYRTLTVENTPQTAPVMDAAYRARQWIEDGLTAVMGDDARVAMALLFGERSGLSSEEYESFQKLGIAHIMSVSGLHIGMMAALILLLCKKLRLHIRLHAWILAVVLLCYCALSGFSASSLRAAVMAVCLCVTASWSRAYDPASALSLAMLIVLLLQPMQARSAGFVLSFSAVGAIFLTEGHIRHALEKVIPVRRKRSGKRLHTRLYNALIGLGADVRSLLSVSLAAQLGVLLPTAYYFNRIPTYGILINLIIVPLTGSVLTPLYAVCCVLSRVPGLGWLNGLLCRLGTDGLLRLVQLFSELPNASIRVATPPVALIAAVYAAMIILCGRWRAGRLRTWIAALLCVAVGVSVSAAVRPAQLRYIQIAAGQADAALMLDGDTTVVFDTGSDGTELTELLDHEARDIDALYITHLHMDHIGGVEALLDGGITIRQAYLPCAAEEQQVDPGALLLLDRMRAAGIPITELGAGEEQTYGQTAVQVLWPDRLHMRTGTEANAMSMVMRVNFGGYMLLNCADAGEDYESYFAVPCDVLKVSHHGSASCTGDAFLDTVRPGAAIVTCNSTSRSLPAADTLERITSRGIPLYRTDETGDITLTVQNGELLILPYR